MAEQFGNQAEQSITLTAGVSDADLTWPISALGSGAYVIPSDGDFSVRCDDEIVKVTAVSGLDLTVERGAEDTTPAAHATGTRIYNVPTRRGMHRLVQPYAASFSAVTSVTILGTDHGFDFSVEPPVVQVYDAESPSSLIQPGNVTYSALNGDIAVEFLDSPSTPMSGTIIVLGHP